MITFYVVLGCDEQSTNDELKKNYFKLLRETHPDKTGLNDIEQFIRINSAWETLGDKLRRKQYDDWLSEQRLRETKELIGGEVNLDTSEAQQFENVCRCGGIYLLETEELEKILDYVLIECSNCSLCLKIWKKPASELLA